MYSPILRNRQSEILALKHIPRAVCKDVIPVIDIASPTKGKDLASGVQYVERNLKRTETIASNYQAIFVDSSELDPNFVLKNNTHPLVGAANSIVSAGSISIPVTGLHRDLKHQKAVTSILESHDIDKLCLRLDFTDISTSTLTHRGVNNYLKSNSIKSTQTYLLLDLQCVFGMDLEVINKMIYRLLNLLCEKKWAGIIVGGYGLPDKLSSAVATNDQIYLNRNELDIYNNISKYECDSKIWFSDYTTLTPTVVELDWQVIHKVMAPKALYALEKSWFVIRGGAFAHHPDGYDQYYDIAKQIVALDDYCGKDFCYGDKYIWERSEPDEDSKPGSPGSWITACVNHHITFTAVNHA